MKTIPAVKCVKCNKLVATEDSHLQVTMIVTAKETDPKGYKCKGRDTTNIAIMEPVMFCGAECLSSYIQDNVKI